MASSVLAFGRRDTVKPNWRTWAPRRSAGPCAPGSPPAAQSFRSALKGVGSAQALSSAVPEASVSQCPPAPRQGHCGSIETQDT